jgi:hypothetical protein
MTRTCFAFLSELLRARQIINLAQCCDELASYVAICYVVDLYKQQKARAILKCEELKISVLW